MRERPARPLTPREAAKALGVSLPTLRRYAQVWERTHGPLPRTPTGDRLWPREVVEAIAEARARGAIGRLTRAKLPPLETKPLPLEPETEALRLEEAIKEAIKRLECRLESLEEAVRKLAEKLEGRKRPR